MNVVDARLAATVGLMRPSALREILSTPTPPRLSLGGGLPPAEAFPFAEVGEIVAALMAGRDVTALQYTSAEGDVRLRALVAARLTAELGREVTASDLVITTGSQQGIDLAGRVLLDPGDVAVVESPTYVGALRPLVPLGARVVGVPCDDDGLDTEDLAARLAGGLRPKLVYLVANFSNPSGATLSLERRHQLAGLADRYGFVIIEDDQYGRLRFRGDHLPALASLTANVAYLSGFSKVVAPGLRVGFIFAPAWMVRPLILAKQAADLAASSLGQRIVIELFQRPEWFERHLAHLREVYRVRADALVGAVADRLAGRLRLVEPQGGLFCWATITRPGINADGLAAAALRQGLAVVPGNEFSVDGGFETGLRLSYSTLTPAELVESVDLLAAAFDEFG